MRVSFMEGGVAYMHSVLNPGKGGVVSVCQFSEGGLSSLCLS